MLHNTLRAGEIINENHIDEIIQSLLLSIRAKKTTSITVSQTPQRLSIISLKHVYCFGIIGSANCQGYENKLVLWFVFRQCMTG